MCSGSSLNLEEREDKHVFKHTPLHDSKLTKYLFPKWGSQNSEMNMHNISTRLNVQTIKGVCVQALIWSHIFPRDWS